MAKSIIVHFYEDGTMLKTHFEIERPLLTMYNKVTKYQLTELVPINFFVGIRQVGEHFYEDGILLFILDFATFIQGAQ